MIRKIANPENFRENVRRKLNPILDDENMVMNLEKGIFNYSLQEAGFRKIVKKWENPQFVQLYTDRLRTIYLNLKNKNLIEQLKSNEITPQGLAFMTHQEMNHEKWQDLMEKKRILDANKFNNNIQASTNLFTCGKCKSKRCTYYSLQTRSSDEPETIFVTCLDCGKNFKKN
jgi:transcription elongation factor S-II